MSAPLYRYQFVPQTPPEEIEAALLLALVATESLHGEAQVRLDAGHALDVQRRTLVIDASSIVGRDPNRLFVGFIAGEIGEGAFQVERVTCDADAALASV